MKAERTIIVNGKEEVVVVGSPTYNKVAQEKRINSYLKLAQKLVKSGK